MKNNLLYFFVNVMVKIISFFEKMLFFATKKTTTDKKIAMSFLFMTVAVLIGCNNKPAEETSNNFDLSQIKVTPPLVIEANSARYCYWLDSSMFAFYKNGANAPKLDKKMVPYFVQRQSTMDYYCFAVGVCTENPSTIFAFLGYDGGDGFIYYQTAYRAFSPRYIAETGDSIISVIERKFPKDDVSDDVRQTFCWLSLVQFYQFTDDLDHDLKELTGIYDKPGFESYLDTLKQDILAHPGEDIREKIVNFTKEVVSGDPTTWNLSASPGYSWR